MSLWVGLALAGVACADDVGVADDAATGTGSGGPQPLCGNGIVDAGEACDGLNLGTLSCTNLALGVGQLACGPQCRLDATGCCGDGNQGEGEGCDDANSAPQDGCSGTCQPEAGWTCSGTPSTCVPSCGDGVVVGVEECDDANAVAGDGCMNCIVAPGWSCMQQPSVCSQGCGNGQLDVGEQCDGANGLVSCAAAGFASGGNVACTAICLYDISGCSNCGDGFTDIGEDCDVFVLGDDCLSLGFGAGALECSADCTFDTTGCGECGNGQLDDGEVCDPPDGVTCGLDCQLLGCDSCGAQWAGAAGTPCCGAAELGSALAACVCPASDCAAACADTLCLGLDATGDDCETCLLGAVDCAGVLQACLANDTEAVGPEDTAAACADSCNNDGDAVVDCDDSDCFGIGACADAELNCADSEDNDGDGPVDCADTDCDEDPVCVVCIEDAFEDNDTFATATMGLAHATDHVLQLCPADDDYVTIAPFVEPAPGCTLEVEVSGQSAVAAGVATLRDGLTEATVYDSVAFLGVVPVLLSAAANADGYVIQLQDGIGMGSSVTLSFEGVGCEDCADNQDNDLDGDQDCADSECVATAFCSLDCSPDDGGNPTDFELGGGNDALLSAVDCTPYYTGPIDNAFQTMGDVSAPATTVRVCEADQDYYLVPDALLSEPCILVARVQGEVASTGWAAEVLDTAGTVLDSNTGDGFLDLLYNSVGVEDLVIRVFTTAPGAEMGQPYELQLRCVGS